MSGRYVSALVSIAGLCVLTAPPSNVAPFVAVSVVAAAVATGAQRAANVVDGAVSDASALVGESRRGDTSTVSDGVDAVRLPDVDPAVTSLVARPFTTVEDAERRLRALERRFRERNDRRSVFLTVYARVTGEVKDAIRRDTFDDPRWVAEYLVEFANFYRRAVLDFETGREATLPTAWRLAFRAAERRETLVLQHAALGVNAHVSFDLAFALSAVGVGDDRRTKYRDHQRINLVLWRLVDVTVDRLAERYAPGIATLTGAVGPLVTLCWFCALVLGRELAWWAALVLSASPSGPLARTVRWFVAAVSASVAGIVLGPTVHPLSARALRAVAGRLGARHL